MDCRTCKYNTYAGITTEWVDCNHPITLERGPRWQSGDPAFVNMRTSDVPISRIGELVDCPTWEPRP